MTVKRLVVIGASSGGIDTLRTIISGLPDAFSAPIAIVIHTSPESPGVIPDILRRITRRPVSQAYDRQRIEAGHIYVASPDCHLLIEPGRLRVTKGPREHRFRPAIDPLFRSAAQVFGPAAIGVILTGNLDDGTAGLWAIERLGGTTIVQDPRDALVPSMPEHALAHVAVDHVMPSSRIPSLLHELTVEVPHMPEPMTPPPHIDVEVKIAKEENPRDAGLERLAEPSRYACPDCHGVLLEIEEGTRIRFRCHAGHAYSVESLLAAMSEGIERAVVATQRAFEESSLLMKRVASQLKEHNQHEASARMLEASERAKRRAEAIVELVRQDDPVPIAHE